MKKIFITTTALLIACTLSAADLFVSPEGNDRNPGTKDSPKATLTAALRQARELRRLNDESVKGGITIHLEAGDYHLYEPVFIRPEDSGTEASPTVITSDGNAVLNGGVEIRNWKKQGKLWVADVPMFNGRPLDFRQLWINGQKAVRARDVADFEKMYNPQIQISAESETKRSIFREKDKTKRSKKESAQHSKSRNKSFVMTSVSAL